MKKYIFTLTSSNVKTGNIPQVYSSPSTCPVRCPYKGNGCYTENWGACFTYKRVDRDGVTSLEGFVKELPKGKLIRHNVGGDMAVKGTNLIDNDEVKYLTKVYKGFRAYTYTHCEINEVSAKVIKEAMNNGFMINVSCESKDEVKNALSFGLKACLVIPEWNHKGTSYKEDGITYKLCQNNAKGLQCVECKLCQNKKRNTVICFPAHGAKAKSVKTILLAQVD